MTIPPFLRFLFPRHEAPAVECEECRKVPAVTGMILGRGPDARVMHLCAVCCEVVARGATA